MTTLPRKAVEPPIVLQRDGPAPMAVQITAQLRDAVAGSRLRAGERLPSSRALANALGVSRTVVANAYIQLSAEGWLEARHGSGTYVTQGAAGNGEAAAQQVATPAAGGAGPSGPPEAALTATRPGIPWVAGIDQAAWRRAWRRAGDAPPSPWPDPRGLPALRTALCDYLRRSRGLSCTPGHILITRGAANGLSLLALALLRPGERAGLEEPGYPVGRAILAARGARVMPCPVDSHGLLVDRLPGGLRLVYVTPAHQYPLGGRLPVPRRQALVTWARRTGGLVVEDDYDSEFRYDVAPLPALYGLDPDVVAYLGTTAKTLTPALGVGWLVAKPDLVTALAETRESIGDRPAEAAQRAVLSMIETGDLHRHIRRMRREYARRRDAIVSLLSEPGLPVTLLGDTAGLHVVLELHRADEDEVAAAVRGRGVAVQTLGQYFSGPQSMQGLVLGYGGLSLGQVTAAVTTLRDVLAGRPSGPGQPG